MIWKSGDPEKRIFGFLDTQILGDLQVRKSEDPDLSVLHIFEIREIVNPEIRDLRKSGFSDF